MVTSLADDHDHDDLLCAVLESMMENMKRSDLKTLLIDFKTKPNLSKHISLSQFKQKATGFKNPENLSNFIELVEEVLRANRTHRTPRISPSMKSSPARTPS
eukprot:16195_1